MICTKPPFGRKPTNYNTHYFCAECQRNYPKNLGYFCVCCATRSRCKNRHPRVTPSKRRFLDEMKIANLGSTGGIRARHNLKLWATKAFG